MSESHQPEPRQTEGRSQTGGPPETQNMDGAHRKPVMDDAHREAPGEPVQPEAGHPVRGASSSMPEQVPVGRMSGARPRSAQRTRAGTRLGRDRTREPEVRGPMDGGFRFGSGGRSARRLGANHQR